MAAPAGEYGTRDRALVQRAYAAARAELAEMPPTQPGLRDFLAGGVAALAWFLGETPTAPVSGEVLPPDILRLRNEADRAESLIRHYQKNERELSQNFLVGAQQACMWLNRECADPPGYYEDDADT